MAEVMLGLAAESIAGCGAPGQVGRGSGELSPRELRISGSDRPARRLEHIEGQSLRFSCAQRIDVRVAKGLHRAS
jgi:hypothetical protein